MKILMSLFMLMSMASFAAAGTQEKQAEPQRGGTTPMMQMMQNCPMNVQGAEIAVADTSNGIALTLTTKSGNVDELRSRTERMASMHSAPGAVDSSSMPGSMMSGVAKYEAIPNGARLTLTPKDPAKLTEFRKQVRSHVEPMTKEGGCSMMQSMMQGMMGGVEKPATAVKLQPKKEESEVDHSAHHPAGATK